MIAPLDISEDGSVASAPLIKAALALAHPGELFKQRALLNAAEDLARERNLGPQTLGHLRLQQARLQALLCDYPRILSCSIEAGELFERIGDTLGVLRAALFRVWVCVETGDTTRALDLTRRLLVPAREGGHVRVATWLLTAQAFAFCALEEYGAAARCAEESLRIGAGRPGSRNDHEHTLALLAAIHVHQADALFRDQRPADAQAQLQQARDTLPKMAPGTRASVLRMTLFALSCLGDTHGARPVAGQFIREMRGMRGAPYWRIQSNLTMGLYYLSAGCPGKAARRLQKAIELMEAVGRIRQLPVAMRALAEAHASLGQHGQALNCLRETQSLITRKQPEAARLHGRMIALQRDVEWRRAERETVRLHTQRLAVVGRLMAQIYLSLEAPLVAVNGTISQCLDEIERLEPEDLADKLRGVVSRIDEASSLARQLKMFSYRAAPQSMVLDLQAALREAWQGMGTGRETPLPPLTVAGTPPPQVRGDVQRLAVLLRILLIEIERMAGQCSPRATFSVQSDAVRVEFACVRHAAAVSRSLGVGFTLCEEIAREMQGALRQTDGPGGEMLISLELPIHH